MSAQFESERKCVGGVLEWKSVGLLRGCVVDFFEFVGGGCPEVKLAFGAMGYGLGAFLSPNALILLYIMSICEFIERK